MPVSVSMAGVVSANAAAASASARRAREAECGVVLRQFDSHTATTGEMREYAACVQTLYPDPPSPEITTALKFLFVVAIIGMAVGAVKGWDIEEKIMLSVLGFLLAPLGTLFVAGVGYGIYWLFI